MHVENLKVHGFLFWRKKSCKHLKEPNCPLVYTFLCVDLDFVKIYHVSHKEIFDLFNLYGAIKSTVMTTLIKYLFYKL